MKNKLTTLGIAVVACMSILSFIYGIQASSQIESLKVAVEQKTNKVIVYQGQDGNTPVKGVDYFDGANGINAVSYSITNSVIREVPIIGPVGPAGANGTDGKDGVDGAYQVNRFNSDTGDYETKLSTDRFWEVAIPCIKFVSGCKE